MVKADFISVEIILEENIKDFPVAIIEVEPANKQKSADVICFAFR